MVAHRNPVSSLFLPSFNVAPANLATYSMRNSSELYHHTQLMVEQSIINENATTVGN